MVSSNLAMRLGTNVELVHTVPPLRVPERWQAQTDSAVLARVDGARRQLDLLAQQLPTSVTVRLRATDGAVPEVLAEAAVASSGHHPLLVLGRTTRTHSPTPGPVAYRTSGLAKAPVLMCLDPQTDAEK
jgi:hypothetical protein